MYKLTKYRRIFLIRFLAFCFIQIGFITLLLIIEPVVTEEGKYQFNQLVGKTHILPRVVTSTDSKQGGQATVSATVSFGDLETNGDIITPIDTNFGIVIEKLNANAKVIPDVDSTDEKAYSQALGKGVAHAKGTAFPGQVGNIYLFSHSVDAPWNIVRFNAIFYLLGKLDNGDRIIMFYKGRRYDYIVFDKAVVSPSDTNFLTDSYNDSVLTLQTCDPPGTLLNRLVVRAKLAGE